MDTKHDNKHKSNTKPKEQPNQDQMWFSAKKYGIGWGVPTSWQGWLFLAAYGFLVVVTVIWFLSLDQAEAESNYWLFIGLLLIDTAVLLKVMRRHGPPFKWRWGEPKNSKKKSNFTYKINDE